MKSFAMQYTVACSIYRLTISLKISRLPNWGKQNNQFLLQFLKLRYKSEYSHRKRLLKFQPFLIVN